MQTKTHSSAKLYWSFSLSCFIAFTLMLFQVPDWLSAFWPDWIALTIVYWALNAPNRIGPFAAFIIGTMVEVLTVKTFGVLSFALAFLAFVVNLSHLQLRVMSNWQKVFLVIVLVAFFKLINLWFDGLVGTNRLTVDDWYSMLGNLAVWPFLSIVLDELRRVSRMR